MEHFGERRRRQTSKTADTHSLWASKTDHDFMAERGVTRANAMRNKHSTFPHLTTQIRTLKQERFFLKKSVYSQKLRVFLVLLSKLFKMFLRLTSHCKKRCTFLQL